MAIASIGALTYSGSTQDTIVAVGGVTLNPPNASFQAILAAKVNEIIAAATGIKASETKTSGALSVDPALPYSLVSVTGTVAFTLADGTIEGQVKEVECTVAATTPLGTLTIATPFTGESATHVFTAVCQKLTLVWRAAGWHMLAKNRAGRQAVVVGTTVLTGYDMAAAYDLSVDGTVHSTTTKGIPNGTVPGEKIHIDVLTAANTATGDIAITAKTTVGVAATNWGSTGTSLGSAGTATTAAFCGYWDGSAWQAEVVTTATLA